MIVGLSPLKPPVSGPTHCEFQNCRTFINYASRFRIDMKKSALSLFFILSILMAGYTQIIKTSLTVTVRDELGNTAEGVNVKLFEAESDYLAEKNAAAEGTTDAKGVIKFKNLKAIAYYVLARKGDKDNAGKGEATGKLEENKFNKVTIIIE